MAEAAPSWFHDSLLSMVAQVSAHLFVGESRTVLLVSRVELSGRGKLSLVFSVVDHLRWHRLLGSFLEELLTLGSSEWVPVIVVHLK